MRIGIVGLGYRLGYLARVINEFVPEARFVGYVDPAPAGLPPMPDGYGPVDEDGNPIGSSAFMRRELDPGKSYETIDALVAAEQPDLMMVGSPNFLHLEHIRACLAHGLKVFTEKPVVISEEQTFELMDLLAEHGDPDKVMIGLVLRYAPLYRDLVAARDAGTLGDITSVEASEHIPPYHGAFFMRDWRRNTKHAGGFMLEKCCHDIDLYQGLIGNRPKRVASFGGRKSFVPKNAPTAHGANDMNAYYSKPSGWNGADKVFDSEGDIIDFQTAIVEFEGGETLTFNTNLNVPDDYRRFCVIGSKGQAEGDFVRNFFKLHDARTTKALVDKTYETSEFSAHYGADEQMIIDIFAHLTEGKPLPVSILDGLAAGLTAIKMDEAREKHEVIDMTETWKRFDSYKFAKANAA